MTKRGETQTEIVDEIGVDKSTISRELDRTEGRRGYRDKQAHRSARERREGKRGGRITEQDWDKIDDLIEKQGSPEQIRGRPETENNGSVRHEWI